MREELAKKDKTKVAEPTHEEIKKMWRHLVKATHDDKHRSKTEAERNNFVIIYRFATDQYSLSEYNDKDPFSKNSVDKKLVYP